MTVRREVLYYILSEFGIFMKLVRLIKMCLIENCSKVCIGKILCSKTSKCFIAVSFQLCFRMCHQKVQGNEEGLELDGTHHVLV